MSKRAMASVAGGCLALIACLASVPAANAADIYDQYNPRTSGQYEDPRYADIYTHPAPPPPVPRYAEPRYTDPPRYEQRYDYRPESPPVYRDRYGYLEPMNPRHRYRPEPACTPREEIRRSLVSEGWRDFDGLDLRGEVAAVRARRPNGQLYALKVDRCTGEIVHARPLDDREGPYQYRGRYSGNTY